MVVRWCCLLHIEWLHHIEGVQLSMVHENVALGVCVAIWMGLHQCIHPWSSGLMVPLQVNSNMLFSIQVKFHVMFLFKACNQVIQVSFVSTFDAKIIYDWCKGDIMCFMEE